MARHLWASITLAAALSLCFSSRGDNAKRAAKPKDEHPPLLGARWDFSDASLTGWRWKDNARVSLAEEGGNKALRLESGFKPYKFTWVTRFFEPRSLKGVAHIRFRLRGDASGHRLELHLGAPSPQNRGRSLYYINSRQAVKLDFAGWRDASVDVAQFDTPDNGLRDRDLARVTFLEFTVHAENETRLLDIRIDDIEFVGLSQEEIASIERRRQERARLVAELSAALGPVEKRLTAIREDLDKAAAQGEHIDAARVYWTALDWTTRDVKRSLACDELDVVRQTKPILADLQKRVEEPQRVLGKILPKAPDEGDPLDSQRNPHFKSVIDAVRPATQSERWWPKGQEGYRSIPDAWTFRRLGDDSFAAVWAMTRAKSPLRHHPMLATNALNLFDVIAHQHTDGDFNVNRTAVHGHDPNINRFCLAPALDAWCELKQAYPDLLPPALEADLEAGLKRLVDAQVKEYGLARLAQRPDVRFPAYPNMDVHYILIMERAHQLWKGPQYARERDAFVKILQSAAYPMGAFTYVNTQNECFVYHGLDVLYAARYWQLSRDANVRELLQKTAPYYPYNVEPAGMPEHYTDACWKHYWGGGDSTGPAVIAAISSDPLNQQVARTCGAIWGYGRGHTGAIAAEFWRPIAARPLPDNYTIYDANTQGPRGRYGNWSFAGNGRNYGVGFQGKDTFVGCMITDPLRRPMPLDAALQVVTAEVRLNHTGNHWEGGRCHSAQEELTTAVGEDFGSLAVRYTVSRPHWHFKHDELLPWEGTQVWYLSRSRLIGLVALEATADETRAAVHGRIRLGLKRELESVGDESWRYGRLVVRLHGHNYARVVAKPSETTILEEPSRYRSTEITLLDPVSVAAGEQGDVLFKKGTRYWFLLEVCRGDTPPTEEVRRIEQGPLCGLSFREPGRRGVLVFNPTGRAVDVDYPLDRPGAPWMIYQDNAGKGKPLDGAALKTRLEPFRHAVALAVGTR